MTIHEANKDAVNLLHHEGFIDVTFDDGVTISMVGGSILLNAYILSIIPKLKIKIPMISDYSVTNYYTNNAPDGSSIRKAFSRINKDIISDVIKIDNPMLQELNNVTHEEILNIVNNIYNEVEPEMQSGMFGISSYDIIEITKHPKILEAKLKLSDIPTQDEIKSVYNLISDIIHSDEISFSNGLKKLFVTGIGNKNQIMQMIGLRGYCVEIDSTIFKYPIKNSFSEGMNNLYYLGSESRTAAFSLTATTESIRKSETLGRLLQIVGSYLHSIYPGDCGTTEYLKWYVEGPNSDYGGDLSNLVGSYYKETILDKELKVIKESDTHLIGKTILLRNVSKCKTRDKHGVCSVCLGGLAHNVPLGANLGTLMSANLSQAASQALLSTKHHMGSAGTQKLVFDAETLEVFDVNDKGVYSFKESWFKKGTEHRMFIPLESVRALMTVSDVETLSKININKISKLDEIYVWYKNQKEEEVYYTIKIKQNGRSGIFSRKFVEYIIENLEIYENKSVVVDLTKLRSKNKVISLENKSYSFFELVKEIETTIKKRRILKGGKSRENIDDLISNVFRLFNKKLSANIATISCALYAYMVKDLPNNNFDLGRHAEGEPQLVSLDYAVSKRSAGPLFLYDNAHNEINASSIFRDKDKPSHLYDGLFMPNESIREFDKRAEFRKQTLGI